MADIVRRALFTLLLAAGISSGRANAEPTRLRDRAAADPSETRSIRVGEVDASLPEFAYGPIHSLDIEVQERIKGLYREQFDLELAMQSKVQGLVSSLADDVPTDQQLAVQGEIKRIKEEWLVRTMTLGLQIAQLNGDSERASTFERALDQVLHPEKYAPLVRERDDQEARRREPSHQ